MNTRTSLLRSVCLGFLLFVVTSCSQPGTTGTQPDPVFAAAAGTLNYGTNTGTSFMFTFNLETAPSEPIELTITGPEGWNNGAAVQRVFNYRSAGRRATWINVFRDAAGNRVEAASGTYRIEAVIDGDRILNQALVEASDKLARATGLTASTPGNAIRAAWQPVAGAESYLIELTKVDSDQEYTYTYTTATEAVFPGLTLTTGDTYILGVTAFPADFSSGAKTAVPKGPFNTSFASMRFMVD